MVLVVLEFLSWLYLFLFSLCDSRKYPYPPHGWLMEIPKGWGG